MLKNFEEYFAEYHHYDNGGKIDKAVIAQAKNVYEQYTSAGKIKSLYPQLYSAINRGEYKDNFAEKHLSISCALRYANYVKQTNYH